MVFNLIDIGGAGAGTQTRVGFQTAADFWSSKFNDNIVVNLQIGMSTSRLMEVRQLRSITLGP
jgi:hypothetical protein